MSLTARTVGDVSLGLALFFASIYWVSRNADALTFSDNKATISAHKTTKTRVKVTSIDQLPLVKGVYVKSVDGDTSHYKIDGVEVSARYTGVDTPEFHYFGKAQKGGKEANDYINTLIKLKNEYDLRISGMAAHRRPSIFAYNGNVFINEEIVKSGWGWPSPEYLKRFPYLVDRWNVLWEKAKKEKRGVWSLEKNPTPPWAWRDEQDRLNKRGKYKK